MKIKAFSIVLGVMLASGAWAQQSGEPIQGANEVPLGGFPGCSVAPPKGGCDARIACRGVGTLFGTSGVDLQAATEEAAMEARSELAKFYNSKQKAQQSLAKVREDTAKSTSDGGKAISSSMTRMMASVSSTSADAILSGVQILGRDVDVDQKTVTIKIGVSCKSQEAAAKSQAGAARAAASSSTGATQGQPVTSAKSKEAESYKVAPGSIRNMRQEIKNADDF